MMSSATIMILCICMLLASYTTSFRVYSSFQPQPIISSRQRSRIKTTQLSSSSSSSSIVQPNESSTIGTVGSGYLPILIAKLAAHRQHGKSWIICPAGDMETMQQLTTMATGGGSSTLANLEIVPSSDTDRVDQLLSKTDAFLMATDDVDSVLDPSIINYLLDPTKTTQMKRIVAMSRNLNGSGMGMFVTASKKAANAQVWDNSNKAAYIEYENTIKQAAKNIGADYTIVRAGTLKGGSTGGSSSSDDDDNRYYSQYLHESYYELTKNDLVTWQLLFDCNVRGVTLTKGDVQKGPGMQAVFTATGSEQHEGDTGRCGLAEAMVRSLEIEYAKNVDFGVGTVASREVPSDEEWDKLFRDCLKH